MTGAEQQRTGDRTINLWHGVALLITIEAIELAIVAFYKYKHRKDLLIPICSPWRENADSV